MPYKNPEKQKEYQRNWQREQKAAQGSKITKRTLNLEEVQTAKGLLDLLARTLEEVETAGGDVFIRARLKGYLISIGLKCVETADLEGRITALEEQTNDQH